MIPQRRQWVVFTSVFLIALTWAIYTGHAWEDYYITYRASKNLATGHGLVFTQGEKLHTFTSPLGVLLPALASVMTANKSDEAALWIFRIMSICALSGAAVLLWQVMRRNFIWGLPTFLLIALFATDAKSVDFSINGMETGFVLLFLTWTLYALLTNPPKQAVHLGLAWAGLMWSRPDSFIYIGLLCAGAFLFRSNENKPETRLDFLKVCFRAGIITTLCYLPWFLWAWFYYGSPVPNTIVAKGLESPKPGLGTIYQAIIDLPSHALWGQSSFHVTFLPTYGAGENSGWPVSFQTVVFLLAIALSVVWIFPFIRREARIASLTFAGGQFYLSSFASFPYAWYLPTLSVLGFFIIAVLLHQMISMLHALARNRVAERRVRQLLILLKLSTVGIVLGSVLLGSLVAYQLRIQQRVIEEGVRRNIGYWLRDHAHSSHDTVFLEPLGYIGYYSGLKMFDFPGLASREMVAARKILLTTNPDLHGTISWPPLIRTLQPDWLVLRSFESATIREIDGDIFNLYDKVQSFDATKKISQYKFLPGRGYIAFDSVFDIYHKKPGDTAADFNPFPPGSLPLKLSGFTRKEAFVKIQDESFRLNVHAPSILVHPLPPGFHRIMGEIGFAPGAYANPPQATDGADFIITLVDRKGHRTQLFQRYLAPVENAGDRGSQKFSVALPENASGSIEFVVDPGPRKSNAFDWTYWSKLHLAP